MCLNSFYEQEKYHILVIMVHVINESLICFESGVLLLRIFNLIISCSLNYIMLVIDKVYDHLLFDVIS